MNLSECFEKAGFHFFEPLNLEFLQNSSSNLQNSIDENFLFSHVEFLRNWIAEQKHGEMKYLEQNEKARTDSKNILQSVQTAICFLVPYADSKAIKKRIFIPNDNVTDSAQLPFFQFVSKYAQGKDYHKVITSKLSKVLDNFCKLNEVNFESRILVDSVPFFDRAHAKESGLGFVGKNTMLIRPKLGSFFFISTVLFSVNYSTLLSMLNLSRTENTLSRLKRLTSLDCRDCNKCQVACPTGALNEAYKLDASKCLSYQTIEKRGEVLPEFRKFFTETVYGCDICQDVCPYNISTNSVEIFPELNLIQNAESLKSNPTMFEVATMSQKKYEEWFGGTALTRAKRAGLIRNVCYFLQFSKSRKLNEVLEHWKNQSQDELAEVVLMILKE